MLSLGRVRDDRGFTLVEMTVSAVITAAIVTAFAVFMTNVAATQRTSDMARVADRVLASEMEEIAGIRWTNLMIAPASYTDCTLTTGGRAAPAVSSGPATITSDGLNVSITRSVTWLDDESSVTCANTPNDRDQLKKVTVTATWNDGTIQRTRTATVLRSKFGETPVDLTSAQSFGVLVADFDVTSTTGWNVTYYGGSCMQDNTGGTVSIVNSTLRGVFGNTGNCTIGKTVTGLIAGHTYTAVMEVRVPAGATQAPVELDALYIQRQGLAAADGNWTTISNTWVETGTSRVVGPAAYAGVSRSNSEFFVRKLRVYQMN